METGIWPGEPETNPKHIVETKTGAMGSEVNPKAGTDETFRNAVVAQDTGECFGPGTKSTASWVMQEPDTCTSLVTGTRRPDR